MLDSTGLSTVLVASEAVTSGDKGTLIFKIKEVGKSTVIASTSLNIDVK
ncbi:hypothetical protein [Pseudobacillus wudalianchiensis]|nr:hypothetical protein [Bacillus wudalianchiensis]